MPGRGGQVSAIPQNVEEIRVVVGVLTEGLEQAPQSARSGVVPVLEDEESQAKGYEGHGYACETG